MKSFDGVKSSVESVAARLNGIGFERTRRALAALSLSLFVFLYLLISANPPSEEWRFAFLAMSACYAVAFMGVAAEWFWGRWFAAGLGWSGVMVAVASLVMIGWTPVLAVYGGLHAIVVLALAGKKMAERFDLQPAWRERYGMDEFGVDRLKKTVTRASASLPSVILYFLAPKEPGQALALTVLTFLAGGLAVAGVAGAVRLRSSSLLLLASAAVTFLGLDVLGAFPHVQIASLAGAAGGCGVERLFGARLYLAHILAPALLGVSLLPFAGPAARFLKTRA